MHPAREQLGVEQDDKAVAGAELCVLQARHASKKNCPMRSETS